MPQTVTWDEGDVLIAKPEHLLLASSAKRGQNWWDHLYSARILMNTRFKQIQNVPGKHILPTNFAPFLHKMLISACYGFAINTSPSSQVTVCGIFFARGRLWAGSGVHGLIGLVCLLVGWLVFVGYCSQSMGMQTVMVAIGIFAADLLCRFAPRGVSGRGGRSGRRLQFVCILGVLGPAF